jgi:glycosyltransferase involved in cell wall biosynthesis
VSQRQLKVALVHEFLAQYGGAERVLEHFMSMFPDALVYTLVYDEKRMGKAFPAHRVRVSSLQWFPRARTHYKWYLALMPWATESLQIPNDVDLVLSDASAFAKGVRVPPGIPHLCYLHTPTRYLWSVRESYVENAPIPAAVRPFVGPVLDRLKRWDYLAAQRPDAYVANSNNVAGQLKRYYDREALATIFPFVDLRRFAPSPAPSDYFLVLSRIEPYKQVDLVAQAFAELGWPLKIAGSGTRLAQYREQFAKYPNISFLGRVSDDELSDLYAHCRAFIFPPEEDAGMVPLEAMASGRPVLAYGKGGALESVQPGVSGEFFAEQTVASLTEALTAHDWSRYNATEIRNHVSKFDVTVFSEHILQVIDEVRANPRVGR